MAISMVSVATRLTLDDKGLLSEARIVLGSVAPTPIHARAAETLLAGNAPSNELIREAAIEAANEMAPISDVRASEAYRKSMIEVLVRRALLANLADIRKGASSD
jgi:carbon-monoxide dehydrogenase medium subunit